MKVRRGSTERGFIIARFYWGSKNKKDEYQYPSPMFSFVNMTEYRNWAKEVRKKRPKNNHGGRTKFEYFMVDGIWTAETILNAEGMNNE